MAEPGTAPRQHQSQQQRTAFLNPAKVLHWDGGRDSLDKIEREILEIVDRIGRSSARKDGSAADSEAGKGETKNVMLVVEGLDLLLAATGVGVVEMGELVMGLREVCLRGSP